MTAESRKTPLHDVHVAAGARMIDFAGWDMPVWYESATDEHLAVRNGAGLFDLSHMAELFVTGTEAGAALDHALLIEASAMPVGRARYSMICTPLGGIIDDLIVYRLANDDFMVVANASNGPRVFAELVTRADEFDAAVEDRTDSFALIAVQGPQAERLTCDLLSDELRELRYYRVAQLDILGAAGYAARTGYTGEDGFELFVAAELATELWNALLAAGASDGLVPVGLAARDTLRLEAGMPLYGNELTSETTPFDVGSARLVTFTEAGFVGSDALAVAVDEPHQFLVGLHVEGRRPARTGYEVSHEGVVVGVVTSGALSPTLGKGIAIARLNRTPEAGDRVDIDIRGKATAATVVDLPFYRREK